MRVQQEQEQEMRAVIESRPIEHRIIFNQKQNKHPLAAYPGNIRLDDVVDFV
jgi:hypothetical protein